MALLTSEICRLILGFLEDEQLHKTYETFLSESKYLEECKIYLKRGISFQKTVHVDRNFRSVSTETYCIKSDISTQTESPIYDFSTNINTFEISSSNEKERPSLNKRKSCNFKRKNVLCTPTKSFKPELQSNDFADNILENFDETLLDMDSFIKNLCENDFPEKLAQSINEISSKKCGITDVESNHKDSILNTPPLKAVRFEEPKEIEQAPIENLVIDNPVHALSDVNTNKQDPDQSDLNSIKFWIANEDISILAEHYSEPAFETLFEVFNSSREEGDSQTVEMETDEIKLNLEEKKENEDKREKVDSINENLNLDGNNKKDNETILLTDTECVSDSVSQKQVECEKEENKSSPIADSIEKNLTISVSNDKKSMIIIGKNADDVDKATNEWKESNREKDFSALECLASAATRIENENKNENELSIHTSTPNKQTETPASKRPKTIREIYDEGKKVNDNDPEANDTQPKGMCKKNFKKSAKRTSRTYFYDFYQDIKSDVEENDDDMPDIFRYARKVQDKVKQKLICQNRKNL